MRQKNGEKVTLKGALIALFFYRLANSCCTIFFKITVRFFLQKNFKFLFFTVSSTSKKAYPARHGTKNKQEQQNHNIKMIFQAFFHHFSATKIFCAAPLQKQQAPYIVPSLANKKQNHKMYAIAVSYSNYNFTKHNIS